MSKYTALIKRIQDGEAGSREINAAVRCTISPYDGGSYSAESDGWVVNGETGINPPYYSTSLDAIKALPGMDELECVIHSPISGVTEDLLVGYPVGDHHLGMLSWPDETGAPWDIKIGERMLAGATDYLMQQAPDAAIGLLVFLGDFMHYDSFEAVTPTSRNQLDADSRHRRTRQP